MDIACPNCAATYRVPEALLAQGKPLRCVACGETWTPAATTPPEPPPPDLPPADPLPAEPPPAPPTTEVAAAPPPSEPPPPVRLATELPPEPAEAAERPPSPATPPPLHRPPLQRRPAAMPDMTARRSGAALRLAWVTSIGTVLLALAGMVLYSDAIAGAWPPFARVTAWIGG